MYAELFATLARESDGLLSYVDAAFRGAAETLVASDYEDACPIATVALEVASTNEPLRRATAEVFQSWLDGWAVSLERWGGIEPERARSLALELLGAMEGAFVLSRALKSPDPMLAAGAAAVERVRAAIDREKTRCRPRRSENPWPRRLVQRTPDRLIVQRKPLRRHTVPYFSVG